MNANVLHRWLKDSSASHSTADGAAGADAANSLEMTEQAAPAFIRVPLLPRPAEPVEREIKVEVRKGNLAMNVTWPMSAASEFALWSSSLVK